MDTKAAAAGRRRVLAMLLLAAVAPPTRAQIIRPAVITRPKAWTSAAIGWLQQQTICDGDSDACWNFGAAPQYRVSFEMPAGDATALGFSYSTSRLPLVYAGTAAANSCSLCDADATVEQVFGVAHLGAGGGMGLQQVIDLSLGVTTFSNFRSIVGARLGTGKPVTDFTFAIAYGFGFGLSSRLQLFLQQEYAVMIHKRRAGSPNNSAQQSTFRLGGRLGLGNR